MASACAGNVFTSLAQSRRPTWVQGTMGTRDDVILTVLQRLQTLVSCASFERQGRTTKQTEGTETSPVG